MKPSSKRVKEYTDRGLARLTCTVPNCRQQATHQWKVRACDIGGPDYYQAVCEQHDEELNQYTIRFFGFKKG